jgi:hypothetical protein
MQVSDDQAAVYGVFSGPPSAAEMIPGWPYSIVAALEPGRTSWTAVLDAVRLGPDDDTTTTATAAQVREVVGRLRTARQVRDGDPDILLVFDSGYDVVTRLAFLLADLPVQLLGRLRSDRVLQFPAPRPGRTGRPARHGQEFKFADPSGWPEPDVTTSSYGTAHTATWDRLHPKLSHRAAGGPTTRGHHRSSRER